MRRAVLLVMVVLLGDCTFAQKHPGVTVGIVAGTIGLGACELSVEKIGTCSVVGGAAGLVLGGITGLVTLFADTSAHELPPFEEEQEPAFERVRTRTEPPPGLPPDAGVPSAGDAGVPAADAGVPADGSATP
ncbi:MAG TPA: hypothetical protein VFS15_24970 [Kofleriaceae bacterium]|nr:hypothetical protein [Kofleriaceae bacterium]